MNHLVIMAKAPRAGLVKTRLAKSIGVAEATRTYRTILGSTLRRLGRDPRWHTWVAVAPDVTVADPVWPEDVNTIAQPNFLAVNASVDEEHVYLLTKTMYENLGFLSAIHPATKAMAVEKAMAGLPVPLHPGAARYYKEVGLWSR